MGGNKRSRQTQYKKKRRHVSKKRRHVTKKKRRVPKKKVRVSPKFHHVLHTLKGMKMNQRRVALSKANDKFVRDLSNVVGKLRHLPRDAIPSMNPKLQRFIYLRRKSLRAFSKSNTPMKKKRMMVKQKGGIFPALIPIICASIAAAGTVGSAAVGAAVAKS